MQKVVNKSPAPEASELSTLTCRAQDPTGRSTFGLDLSAIDIGGFSAPQPIDSISFMWYAFHKYAMRNLYHKSFLAMVLRRSAVALATALMSLTILSTPALSRIIDGVAIVVNRDAVLVSEINGAMLPTLQEYRTKYSGVELEQKLAELRETVINQAIENKLILQVAKANRISADEKMVDSRIDIIKTRFPSESEFQKALAAKGLTIREYREQVSEQVLLQETLKRVLGAEISVQDYEIREYFDAHRGEFETKPRVKLAQIFLQTQRGSTEEEIEEVRREAEELRILLEDGADFQELASKYSQGPYREKGGIVGEVTPEEILVDLKDAAFSLSTGEISPVIQTVYGFNILMAVEATPARKIEFEEAKPLIEERIREKRRTEKYGDWIEKLKEDSYIDIRI
jgi:parvulin-like peptidyl-prolyl isomerase